MHDCPAPGCQQRVPFNRLACPRHWFRLPDELRRRVWEAWRRGDIEAHLAARDEAIAFWGGAARLAAARREPR